MSADIKWPTNCISCGTAESPLESYSEAWQSTYSESAGKRKTRHYHVAVPIQTYLCRDCKTRSVQEARYEVAKYRVATKAAGVLLVPFIALVFFMNAVFFGLQPGAENYPIGYTIQSFASLTSPWLWMIFGALGVVLFIPLAQGYHSQRIEKPYWNHMSMRQHQASVIFTFKSVAFHNSYRSINPHLDARVNPKFRPRYIPMLSLLWIPLGFSLVGVFIAFPLVVAAWSGFVLGALIIYSLVWIRIFRVQFSTSDTSSESESIQTYSVDLERG